MPALPEWLEEIRTDNVSSASILSAKAAAGLMRWAAEQRPSMDNLAQVTRALVAAQPSMAPIFHLANSVLFAGPDRIEAACQGFLQRIESATLAVAQMAAGLVREGTVVMTHSYSSTVLAAMRTALQSGVRFRVVCTESRPMLEGVAAARELAQLGIEVVLIVDAAISIALPEVRIVFAGADSVTSEGVVNKIGTSVLAGMARKATIDVYALCGTEKILPAHYALPRENPKPPEEILPKTTAGITPLNFYFDKTRLDKFTGIITESGILTPQKLVEYQSAMPIHKVLARTNQK